MIGKNFSAKGSSDDWTRENTREANSYFGIEYT